MVKEYNSNLLKRSITALFLLIPVVAIIIIENFFIFSLLITIFCLLAFMEWIKNNFRHPIKWGFALIFLYFWLTIILIIGIFSSNLILPFFENLSASKITISVFYLFFIIICNTGIFDTFAYIFGSNFGRNPISPVISPNKTWEGLFGGLLMNCIFAVLVCNFFQISYLLILVFSVGGLLAFFGDLLISFHKRENNIKDTGNFLPGHGGVLDRMDSHLLATPVILILSIFLSS